MSPINLDRIQDWINQGRIDPSKPITLRELAATRAVHGIKDGIKLLARGATALTTPINIVVSRASQSAIAAVEALGGTVTTRFYTKYAIHRIRQRKTDPYVSLKWDQDAIGKSALAVGMGSDPKERVKGMGFQYRLPDPTSRKDLEYYRDPKNRGYLSHTVKEGESPSLYFKPPQPAHEVQAKRGRRERIRRSRLRLRIGCGDLIHKIELRRMQRTASHGGPIFTLSCLYGCGNGRYKHRCKAEHSDAKYFVAVCSKRT